MIEKIEGEREREKSSKTVQGRETENQITLDQYHDTLGQRKRLQKGKLSPTAFSNFIVQNINFQFSHNIGLNNLIYFF